MRQREHCIRNEGGDGRLATCARRAASRGAHVFDVLLVATMLENGVDTLYTENTKDFSAFREIRAVNPFRPA